MAELELKFYDLGYFLIEGSKRAEHISTEIMPEIIFSISDCHSEFHPPMAMLSGVREGGFSIDNYQKRLDLSDQTFLEAMSKVDTLFKDQEFGWNSIFFTQVEAQSFAENYLQKIDNLKFFQAIIPVQISNCFLRKTESKTFIPHGLHTAISRQKDFHLDTDNLTGYEIVGYDMGDFHSFVCYSLENEFQKEINVQINENGLISDFDDAMKAVDYCNDQFTAIGKLETTWFAVGLREIPLNMVSL